MGPLPSSWTTTRSTSSKPTPPEPSPHPRFLPLLHTNPAPSPSLSFDNVGGETLDLVLAKINTHGRIVACGSVSQYNLKPDERYALRNTPVVVGKELSWNGFIVSSAPKEAIDEFYRTVPFQIREGKIHIREHITKGLDQGEAFVDMLTGKAQGKAVIVLE